MKRSGAAYLLYSGLLCVAVGGLWAVASFIDLRDGSTWTKRSRYERGPLFHRVEASRDPSGFKAIVVLRGLMPVVLIGTLGMTLLLGAAAQRPRLPQ